MNAILVGGFSEMIELCESCDIDIVGIIDNAAKPATRYPFLGADKDAATILKRYRSVPVVLSPDKPTVRSKLAQYYKAVGFSFQTVISPGARISRSAKVGVGTIIQIGVHVSANTRIGDFVRANVFSNVMHDCVIRDCTTIAPNAVLLGRVGVEEECYIGANATLLPGVTIGRGSMVGAGAVVTKNVPSNTTVKGVPAR